MLVGFLGRIWIVGFCGFVFRVGCWLVFLGRIGLLVFLTLFVFACFVR